MSFEWRGGVPTAQRITAVDTTGLEVVLERKQNARVTSKYLRIRNAGANDLQVFWTADEFAVGADYITIPVASATEPGGLLELPIEAKSIWIKAAVGTTDVEILALHRRG